MACGPLMPIICAAVMNPSEPVRFMFRMSERI
jgi:hypothetical protein